VEVCKHLHVSLSMYCMCPSLCTVCVLYDPQVLDMLWAANLLCRSLPLHPQSNRHKLHKRCLHRDFTYNKYTSHMPLTFQKLLRTVRVHCQNRLHPGCVPRHSEKSLGHSQKSLKNHCHGIFSSESHWREDLVRPRCVGY